MLSRFALILAAAVLAATAVVVRTDARGERWSSVAYVSAEAADELVAVSLDDRSVLRRIRVADGPHNVAATGDGSFVLVTSPPAGRVTLVSGRSLRVLHVFAGLGSPHDVELSRNERFAYVTDEERGQLVVLDLVGRRVAARVSVAARPHDLAVGDLVWVTHAAGASELTALDATRPARPRVVGRLPAGGPAHDISRAPDTANVFLTYWNSGFVGGLDTGRKRLLFRRRAGTLTHHIQFDYFAGDRAWVTDRVGRVLLVSTRDGRVLRTTEGCPGAHHVAVAPKSVAVACHESGRLLVIARRSGKVASVAVGRGLHGVAAAQLAEGAATTLQSAKRAASHGEPIQWRHSRSLGKPWAGRLVNGVRLPSEDERYFTWDPVLKTSPNRAWRRWGSDRLVRTILSVLDGYFAANPDAPRVAIGDLSRPNGGIFDERFGGRGHASHQNGLDVDVYYPRLDAEERAPARPADIDQALSQDLVNRFVRAGAVKVFVGPRLSLRGPRRIVQRLWLHDDHMHVRIRADSVRPLMIGRSERGRPIEVVRLGDPTARPRILVVGCIHGDECAGMAATRRLELGEPSADLWVVHNLNPDGYALGRRQNARGVDLNRNFDSEWQPLGRRWSFEYSGPHPFSERESRIARKLILGLRPDVTIWFHQPQALVRAWGPSIPGARRYARLAGMRFRPIRWPAGTAPNWQNHRFPGKPAYVVELPAGPLSPRDAERHGRAILGLTQ